MARNIPPQAAADNLPKQFVGETITNLKQLYDRGKPKDDAELENRIDEFFAFCQKSAMRPGIESLCLSLSISRNTLWHWRRGEGCGPERQAIIEKATMFIAAFLEQANLTGHLNPATGIFLSKNWLGYKDSVNLEASPPVSGRRPQISKADALGIDTDADVDAELPDFGD